jgi:hypothetical protein
MPPIDPVAPSIAAVALVLVGLRVMLRLVLLGVLGGRG